jgi:hypothetical protein
MLGGVFISHRREDSGGFAGRIYDRLTNRLGRENVFFDVDAIPPGLDFVDVLSDRVGKCDALWPSSASIGLRAPTVRTGAVSTTPATSSASRSRRRSNATFPSFLSWSTALQCLKPETCRTA